MNSLYHCIFWECNACKSICMYWEWWTFAYTIHWGMKAHLTLLEFYMNSESFFFVLCLKYVWALIMMWNIISNVNNEYILLVWSSSKFEFWRSSRRPLSTIELQRWTCQLSNFIQTLFDWIEGGISRKYEFQLHIH